MDPRIKKLADVLVNYSCKVQKGEKVLVSYEGESTKPLARQIIKEIYAKGGYPYTEIRDSSITREILLGAEEKQIEFMCEYQLKQMQGMDAYIAIRASDNVSELSDVPTGQMSMYSKILRPVQDYR